MAFVQGLRMTSAWIPEVAGRGQEAVKPEAETSLQTKKGLRGVKKEEKGEQETQKSWSFLAAGSFQSC